MNTIYKKFLNLFSAAGTKEAESLSELAVYVATDMGKLRSDNEDNFYADGIGCRPDQDGAWSAKLRRKTAVFAVCDGMGGENCGKEASAIASAALSEGLKKYKDGHIPDIAGFVKEYVKDANHRICEMAFEDNCGTSGSTLAMICIENDIVNVFHIGDSRIYYYNGGTLRQLTEDHTLAVSKLKANIYTEEEARTSPDSHKLTTFLGADKRDVGLKASAHEPFDISDGILLICSDGLTDMCSDEEIADILKQDTASPAQALVEKALSNGGEDNVTCVVVRKI